MLTNKQIAHYMCNKIQDCELNTVPCPNFICNDIFPDETYAEILKNLPSDDSYKYQEGDGGKEKIITRLRLILFDEYCEPLADKGVFFKNLRDILCSNEIKETLFTKFKQPLEKRFKKNILKIPAHPHVSLIRDLPGYHIGPHLDTPAKAVTWQIYLPSDSEHVELGTNFLRKEKNEYLRLFKVPYLPNQSYSFVVGDKSWHSVDKLPLDINYKRDSIMIIYYLKDKKWPT